MSWKERVSQIFQELLVSVVYICVLVLANLDSNSKLASKNREYLGSAIVLVNIILNAGCTLIMSLNTLELVWTVYKNYSNKKKRQVHQAADVSDLADNSPNHINIEESRAVFSINVSTIQPKLTVESNYKTTITQSNDRERTEQNDLEHFDSSTTNTQVISRRKKIKRPTRNNFQFR